MPSNLSSYLQSCLLLKKAFDYEITDLLNLSKLSSR